MSEKTLFTKFLGDSPKIRVLDMLITGRELEYCLSDIAAEAGIGRATLYRMLDQMLKDKVIAPTRRFGRIQLYKLNLDNIQVQELVKMYDKLTFEAAEKAVKRLVKA